MTQGGGGGWGNGWSGSKDKRGEKCSWCEIHIKFLNHIPNIEFTYIPLIKKIANKNGAFRFMRYGNKVRAQEMLLFEKSV